MFDYDLISVGERYEQWKVQVDAFSQIHFRESYWELAIGFPSIRESEISDFHFGSATMTYTVINGCLFFLFKFGNQNWVDVPYEPRLHDKKFEFYSFEAGTGLPLNVIIVDNATGEVKAMRSMGLGTILSNHVHSACRTLQRQKHFNKREYQQRVAQIYNKYPTSAAMLKTVKPEDIFIIANEADIKQ